MCRVTYVLSTTSVWQMYEAGRLLELLKMLLVHGRAKSQVIFFELVHNGSFWHELSATPEPFPGANYMPGRCEA